MTATMDHPGAPPTMAPPPPPTPPSGITIPSWIIQLIPVLALLVGAVMVFAQQRADVDQLKQGLVEIKATQLQFNTQFVPQRIFDLKMAETERNQAEMNKRFDKIEDLINGLYKRLPSRDR